MILVTWAGRRPSGVRFAYMVVTAPRRHAACPPLGEDVFWARQRLKLSRPTPPPPASPSAATYDFGRFELRRRDRPASRHEAMERKVAD